MQWFQSLVALQSRDTTSDSNDLGKTHVRSPAQLTYAKWRHFLQLQGEDFSGDHPWGVCCPRVAENYPDVYLGLF